MKKCMKLRELIERLEELASNYDSQTTRKCMLISESTTIQFLSKTRTFHQTTNTIT